MTVYLGQFYGCRFIRHGERKGRLMYMVQNIISDNKLVDVSTEIPRPLGGDWNVGKIEMNEWICWTSSELGGEPRELKRLGVATPAPIQEIINRGMPPLKGVHGVMDVFLGEERESCEFPAEPEPSSDALSIFMGIYEPTDDAPPSIREQCKTGTGAMDAFDTGRVR